MNKFERVMAAYNGEQPDRVPCAFWYHFPKGYEAGDAAVQIHLDFFEESKTDLCKIMNENSCPNNPAIETAQDWDNLKSFTMQEDFIVRQVELTKKVMQQMKGNAVVLATVHGLVASAYHILGGVDLYDHDGTILGRHLRENPQGMHHAFDVITDYLKNLCQLFLDAGVDGIYFASLGGERRMFTDKEFAEFIAPREIEIMKSIKDVPCFNILHMCKSDLNLERYKNYPANVLNWGVFEDNISLEEGRSLFGADKVYLGGMDDRDGVIVDGTLEEIRCAAQSVVDSFGWNKFILGADCTLPTNLPAERMHAVTEGTVISRKG